MRLRLWMVCLALLAPAALPAVASATTYTVDSTGDLPDKDSNDGICKDTTNPPVNAKCTLRAAIMQANAHAGSDTIAFSLGIGLATISPLSQLPEVTDTVDINGTSQPGWNGIPLIQLSGALAPGPHAAPGAQVVHESQRLLCRGAVVDERRGLELTARGLRGRRGSEGDEPDQQSVPALHGATLPAAVARGKVRLD